MKIIETKNLCYSYDDKLALDNVNISFEEGKTTAILGGNGAGKSTLFLNLNGVLKKQAGEIFLNGERVEKKDTLKLRQNIGIVFQDPEDQLFSSSVIKDVSFGAMNLRLKREEVQKRVEKAMKDTGILDLRDKPTYALSYGQKKRVAIAGVLVMEPRVMILDEPTAGLDPSGCSEILGLLEKIRQENNVTIIIATHEMDIVPLYCDNAYVLDRGRVVYNGSVRDLFKEPKMLRERGLRLPRITHLMQILRDKDNLDVDPLASTISSARKTINKLVKKLTL